jgi:hypothetical protein
MGKLAPVVIAPGTFGNRREITVSPQHRMLLQGFETELHFGTDGVLAPALALVDGVRVRRVPMLFAQYFHILLDRHEVIYAEGAPTESFLPGAEGWKCLGPKAREGILRAAPALADGNFAAYGPAARRVLTVSETQFLMSLRAARDGKAAAPATEAPPPPVPAPTAKPAKKVIRLSDFRKAA